MTVSPTFVHAIITIGFGAIAGGVTNAVAIWMLFHPHEPRGVGPFRIQGAIPKNHARLAKTIGRTVGNRLLTPEDLARQFASSGLREAFHAAIRDFVQRTLETERGALRTELSPALVAEIESALAHVGPALADRLAQFAATPEFRDLVDRLAARLRESVGDRPVATLLTEARRDALRSHVQQWVADAAQSAHLERTVHDWMRRQLVRAADDRTPLLERLPPGLVAAVERAIAGYLPVALERLAGVLRDPGARARIERALHDLFRRFLKDLMLHERIVARLVVTERTIARMLDNLGRDGVEELGRTLDEPEMRDEIARSVNDAVVSFLQRPLAAHVEALGPERSEGLAQSATGYVVALLRDPGTQAYAVERLDRALAGAERWTWTEILDRLPPERAAGWLADGLQSERARGWIADGTAAALGALLDRPIGRPVDRLGPDAAERITRHLEPALWGWTQRQVPAIVAKLDIPAIVEEKVLGFSLERMEQIVRQTTQRELDLIVRLGYLLGAFVGAIAFGVGLFFS